MLVMVLGRVRIEILLWKLKNKLTVLSCIVYMQSSVGGGERSDAASAYLHPVDSRTNLDILINTQVTRLVQSGTDGYSPIFKQVEMAQSSAGKPSTSSSQTY